ncbi:DEP domain-containing protein 1A-like [Oppia nitens]|uniref:DEP domain-containing protein 1A-like n=1 Tax=Oppia nitens TaxID=1686743 RepID=UPI0023DBCE43|nr:DEP domain-containing protein 1A-like [Oppia nitens]
MFRATKVWNQVLHSFYIGIQLKKHRKHMKSHYNCFVANEAVNWIHSYLQMCSHFDGQQITRYQAINLLRKYLQTGVIENVDTRKVGDEFQDNKDLYRFTREANENLPFISSSNLKPMSAVIGGDSCEDKKSDNSVKYDEQCITRAINEMSLTERCDVFKQIFFDRFSTLLPKVDDFIRKDEIISLNLMHNMTRISPNGVVRLTDKTEDLPHWVMSAMKCLANWPKASGSDSCLPKYPGFENDVFAVVRDYFINIGIPLIPNQLYPLIIHIYDKFTFKSIIPSNTIHMNSLNLNRKSMSNQMPTPVHYTLTAKLNKQNTSTPILESQAPKTTVDLPPNHIYETVFMGDIPVTKIVSIDELTNLFVNNPRIRSRSSFRENSYRNQPMKSNDCTNRYVDAITTIPRIPRKFNCYKSPISESIYKTRYQSPNSSAGSNGSPFGYYNYGFAMQSPTEDGEYMENKSVSSLSTIQMSPVSQSDPKDNLSAQFSKSSNNSLQNTVINKNDDNNEEKLIETLRLCLLLMPSSNRRHLHLLLRLMSKIIQNKEIKFCFNEDISVKDYILMIFTRSILCADKESIYDELKAQKIVCLLLDECKELFKVPQNLMQEINELLVNKAKEKLFSEQQVKQYCQTITSEEFELQRDVMSEYALADLLKSIMTDERLSDRDKLKWIKQFKSYHPDVYDLYFTNQIKVSKSEEYLNKRSDKKMNRLQNKSNLLKKYC